MITQRCKDALTKKIINKETFKIKVNEKNNYEIQDFLFSKYCFWATHDTSNMNKNKYPKAKWLIIDLYNNGINIMYSFCYSNFDENNDVRDIFLIEEENETLIKDDKKMSAIEYETIYTKENIQKYLNSEVRENSIYFEHVLLVDYIAITYKSEYNGKYYTDALIHSLERFKKELNNIFNKEKFELERLQNMEIKIQKQNARLI